MSHSHFWILNVFNFIFQNGLPFLLNFWISYLVFPFAHLIWLCECYDVLLFN
uniref:Uncharacterized protein n=1 Tax=Picea sitchensis TaxID=3332 RepID=D5ABM7_PICSI|nr:unknown [Picea sitchensis]